jgi:hypothetical protein
MFCSLSALQKHSKGVDSVCDGELYSADRGGHRKKNNNNLTDVLCQTIFQQGSSGYYV